MSENTDELRPLRTPSTVLHGSVPGCGQPADNTHSEAHSPAWIRSAVPFKYHAEHRHHIPKPRYRVTNWAEYDAALKRRGSVTVWFTDEAVQAWRAEPRTTPGGQPHYSALAINTALTLRAVFGLALRQTEGLIGSVTGRLDSTAISDPPEGIAASSGVRRQSLADAGVYRRPGGISVRRRNQACHCRPRSEPGAGDWPLVATSAFVGIYLFSDLPEN